MTDFLARSGRALHGLWWLDPAVLYLNHGSVGATPRAVLAAQDAWRARIEREPVRFMGHDLVPALRAAADELGAFLGADGEGIVFVDNATSAINAVLAGIDWQPGDEIVVCREVYPGVRHAVEWHAVRRGARVREAAFALPLTGPDPVLDALSAVLGPRTRLALLDHVTSTLGAVLPLARMIARCRAHHVPVLVDGAHAPGMLDVDLAALAPDWYAGNGHKWLCAPRGSGFLWTAPDRRATTRPQVASVWHGAGYPDEFDWPGTRDPTPWLAIPAALAFLRDLGLEAMRAHQRRLADEAVTRCTGAWGTCPAAPDAMRAALASVALPGGDATPASAAALQTALRDHHAIAVPIYPAAGRLWVRVSAQVYLEPRDFDRLANAVRALLADQDDRAGPAR